MNLINNCSNLWWQRPRYRGALSLVRELPLYSLYIYIYITNTELHTWLHRRKKNYGYNHKYSGSTSIYKSTTTFTSHPFDIFHLLVLTIISNKLHLQTSVVSFNCRSTELPVYTNSNWHHRHVNVPKNACMLFASCACSSTTSILISLLQLSGVTRLGQWSHF